MRVLILDPWGVNGPAKYLNGLAYGVSESAEVSLFTNFYFKKTTHANFKSYNIFFRFSEKRKKNLARKIIRGAEYILGYMKIFRYLKRMEEFDVIHINWLLMYKLDVFFLKKLHCYCKKIVYTAHNIKPHIDGERYKLELNSIYQEVDKIVLHGDEIKKEFIQSFPQYSDKVYLQYHGADVNADTKYNISKVPIDIQKKITDCHKVYLFIGSLFYNKGIDRVIPFWDKVTKNSLLIIAGKVENNYKEFYAAKENYSGNHILFLDYYISDNLLNYLTNIADVLLLPYRHASMSGVVFTAADFSKPIVCTKTGSIHEYVNENMAFIVDNKTDALQSIIQTIDSNYSKEELKRMGECLKTHIQDICNWKNIGKKLVEECYSA